MDNNSFFPVPRPDPDSLAIARIDYGLDLLEHFPCRSELKQVLVVLCGEFLQVLPLLTEWQQAEVAHRVAYLVFDAIIEQPEIGRFRLNLNDWLGELLKIGIGVEVVERLKKSCR